MGEHAVVQAAVKMVMDSIGVDWSGERRTYAVYTGDKDPQYCSGRRELFCLIPTGSKAVKMPPMFNIIWAQPQLVGWITIIGLMQWIWVPSPEEEDEQRMDWVYVFSNDLALPVYLASLLENTPSVVLCPFDTVDTMCDLGAKTAEMVRTMQGVHHISWRGMIQRAEAMAPLFDEPGPETGVRVV